MILKLVEPLRKALATLEKEKQRIEREITVVQAALEALGGKGKPTPAPYTPAPSATRPKAKQRRMSAAARRAVSQRMTAFWAKRRIETKVKGPKKPE